MRSAFSILVAAALLFGSSSAEAARGTAGNNNLMLPPIPPISTAPPQTNPIGGVNTGQSFGVLPGFPHTNPIGGAGTSQNFGALPGNPGSPTFDPNAALPSLNDPGSALAPTPGTSASGINTPSTKLARRSTRTFIPRVCGCPLWVRS